MAYCIQADIEKAIGAEELVQLTDHAGAGVVDAAVLAAAIASADAWINGYIAKQRAVPLDPVPELIKRYSVQETVYLLKGENTTEREELQHTNRENYLRDIAMGKVTLGVDPQPAKSALVAPAVVTVGEGDREITAESLKGLW
jgi:phage gp36-like protein